MEVQNRNSERTALLAEIDLYHVAGTNDSDLIVRELQSEFTGHGSKVSLIPIEDGPPSVAPENKTLGIVFPVAVQMTRACVIDFFHHLPPAKGTACFTVSSLAGGYGGGINLFGRMLARKGYKLIGQREIATPTALFNAASDATKIERWTRQVCSETRAFASNLYTSRTSMRQRLVESILSRRQHRIVVDQHRCISCRMCQAVCPSGGNGCTACGRCVRNCPVDALAWW